MACVSKCIVLCHERCLFVHKHTAFPEDLLIVWGRFPCSQPAKHCFRWAQRGSWLSQDSCFVSLSFFLSEFDMKIPQARGHSVVKCLLAFFLLLTLIDNAPISTYRCWGQQHATIAYSPSCVYAADDKWGRTHISPLRTSRSFLPGNGFTSVPSSPSIRPRTESIVF